MGLGDLATDSRPNLRQAFVRTRATAAAVKVPQYRLRDIEQGRPKHLVPSILVKYVDFLGLKVWFGRWKKANPGIVARLEL